VKEIDPIAWPPQQRGKLKQALGRATELSSIQPLFYQKRERNRTEEGGFIHIGNPTR